MKKTPQPDRSAEAQRVREELAHDESAQRALDAMAHDNETGVDIPPVPDDLRGKWLDRYGEPESSLAKPKENARVSFFERFSRLFVYGGAATALAAVAILLAINFGNPDIPAGSENDPVTMRGGEDFVPRADTIVVFIASEAIPFPEFAESRNAEMVLEASDLDNALEVIEEKELKSALILNASTGKLQTWNGELSEKISIMEISTGVDAYDLSEAIDTFLNP